MTREEQQLRDEFARAALTGLLAYHPGDGEFRKQLSPHEAARDAYKMADAMLAERRRLPVVDAVES